MERLIDTLLEEKQNGGDPTCLVSNIAKGIEDASRLRTFYELDITLISKILKSAGQVDVRTGRRIMRNSLKKYSKRALLLLDSLNCGNIGLSAIKIISTFNDIPVIKELACGIKDLQEENKNLKERLRHLARESSCGAKEGEEGDDGEIEVDWEFKYRNLEVELKARDRMDLEKRLAEAEEVKRREMENNRVILTSDNREMLEACKNGDLEKVEAIVKENPKVVDSIAGSYPSHYLLDWAIIYGHLDIVKFLTQKSIFYNILMNGGSESPLLWAIRNHQIDIIEYFISIDAELDNNYYCYAPCVVAAEQGFLDIVDILIEKGVDIKKHPQIIKNPVEVGRVDVIKYLIDKGVDLSYGIDAAFSYNGKEKIAAMLVNNGADVNAPNRDSYDKNSFLVKGILKNFSDSFLEQILGMLKSTSSRDVAVAVDYGRLNILKKLVERKTLVSMRVISELAHIKEENICCLKYLIDLGYKIEPDNQFIPRSSTYDTEILKELLELGANINANIEEGYPRKFKNALITLAESSYGDQQNINNERFLIENGVDVNFQDNDGNTALHIAARNNIFEFARIILESGKANTALKNNEGKVFYECVEGKKNRKEFQEKIKEVNSKVSN